MVCKTSQISIQKRHYRNNIFLQFRRCSKCPASKSILKDSFFESTNTPIETWIVFLDFWIKEHKLQVRAPIENNHLLLNHSRKSILGEEEGAGTNYINVSTPTSLRQFSDETHTGGSLSENINERFGIIVGPFLAQ